MQRRGTSPAWRSRTLPTIRPPRPQKQARCSRFQLLFTAAALMLGFAALVKLRDWAKGPQEVPFGSNGSMSRRAAPVRSDDPFDALVRRVYARGTRERIAVSYEARRNGAAYFVITVARGKLDITADSVHSALGALHHYCSHYAACSTTWGVRRRPSLPRVLPQIEVERNGRLLKRKWAKHVYAGNVCTQSYSQPWWTWAEWERELDNMALRGVTMPLVLVGREVVMRALLLELGMKDDDILAFFTGPAFLSWHRMGNLKSFAGPMPRSYLAHAERLAELILTRARELGMTPVLPGFSGHVPDELPAVLKVDVEMGRDFSRLPTWSGFSSKHSGLLFVEPTSELYLILGARFIEIQRELFGTDAGHFYSVDQFNEVDPRSNDETYLKSAATASYNSLCKGDPEAVWVMQGWLFVFHAQFWQTAQTSAYLSAVPKGGLLVLDLVSEATPGYVTTDSYEGHR